MSLRPAAGVPDAAGSTVAADTAGGFRHPASDREIELHGRLVGYHLRRGRRRSIGMVVAPEGLRVSAPRWVSLRDIDAVLREKAGWIVAKLIEQQQRAAQLRDARIEWRSGARLPYLGGNLTLMLGMRPRGITLVDTGDGLHLNLGLPEDAAPERIARAVQKWLKQEALRVFAARCKHYTAEMGVTFTQLSLSSARTRWGSASSSGAIRLHWRLVHFALPTIDYVVVHELAHLLEMNHSPRFWSVVRDVLPDFEQARAALKTQILPVLD